MLLHTFKVLLICLLPLFFMGCSSSDEDNFISGSGDAPPSKAGKKTYPTKEKETKTSGEYSHSSTYSSYGTRNGGRQAWRIPRKGPDFGAKIKVVFSDGHTVYVRDTSKNYRESDGFVFKPGIGPNGEGSANTGTAHGGVYLHAPYGNRSTQVTFYY